MRGRADAEDIEPGVQGGLVRRKIWQRKKNCLRQRKKKEGFQRKFLANIPWNTDQSESCSYWISDFACQSVRRLMFLIDPSTHVYSVHVVRLEKSYNFAIFFFIFQNQEMLTEGDLATSADQSNRVREMQDKIASLRAQVNKWKKSTEI